MAGIEHEIEILHSLFALDLDFSDIKINKSFTISSQWFLFSDLQVFCIYKS